MVLEHMGLTQKLVEAGGRRGWGLSGGDGAQMDCNSLNGGWVESPRQRGEYEQKPRAGTHSSVLLEDNV